jgi:hypothetical protein
MATGVLPPTGLVGSTFTVQSFETVLTVLFTVVMTQLFTAV